MISVPVNRWTTAFKVKNKYVPLLCLNAKKALHIFSFFLALAHVWVCWLANFWVHIFFSLSPSLPSNIPSPTKKKSHCCKLLFTCCLIHSQKVFFSPPVPNRISSNISFQEKSFSPGDALHSRNLNLGWAGSLKGLSFFGLMVFFVIG